MSPSGSARTSHCPLSTTSPSSSSDPSPSSPASSSAPSWAPSWCSTTACAGNPTAGEDPASAGCTEEAQPGSALGRLCSIQPLSSCLHPPVANLSLWTSKMKFCSWNCFGFSQSPPRWCQAASASSLQLSSMQADHKRSHCFGRFPKATLKSAYPLPGTSR